LSKPSKTPLRASPWAAAKGGSDFDPKGKSDAEVERFCRAFMDQLYPYIGIDTDVPAGDIGVGGREIAYLYDEYKKKSLKDDGALTGKSLKDGGSFSVLKRPAMAFAITPKPYSRIVIKPSFKGKKVVISGSGNVATFRLRESPSVRGQGPCDVGFDFGDLRSGRDRS
jgi:glutamate dehydrogenase (NADP+)